MTTPTTTHVLGRERLPSMYQPGAQAKMVSAEPLNPSASQDMLPGMGDVRSGNAITDNALAPRSSRAVHQQVVQASFEQAAAKINTTVRKIQSDVISTQAEVDSLRAKGDRANNSVIQRKKAKLQGLKETLLQLQNQRAQILGGARPLLGQKRHNHLAPWQRAGVFQWNRRWIGRDKHRFLEATPMKNVQAPATPDPLTYEPYGISSQRGQGRIRDMQLNIQPVESFRSEQAHAAAAPGRTIDGVGGVMDMIDPVLAWTKRDSFNVPNWMWVSGVGLATLLLTAKKRSRRMVVIG